MHTNIDIDQDLLQEAVNLRGVKTKKATVNAALVEYVRTRKQQKVLEIFGKIEFDEDYDYKAERYAR